MRNEPVRLGWLSILMVVVILCLAIFAVLSVSTARADLSLARMQAEQVKARYLQESEGEQWVVNATRMLDGKPAENDSVLPKGAALSDGKLSTVLTDAEGRTLSIELDVTVSAPYPILVWKHGASWDADSDMSGIWDGM